MIAFYRFGEEPAPTLLRLYRQIGDAVFIETTIEAGLFGHPPEPGPQQIGGLAAGDLDGDGDLDLIVLLTAWGPCAGCPADLDGSGAVDFGDLIAVLSNWG